ncbi:MAG: hypothetical protein ACRCTX_10470, partial [Afipia sp.]
AAPDQGHRAPSAVGFYPEALLYWTERETEAQPGEQESLFMAICCRFRPSAGAQSTWRTFTPISRAFSRLRARAQALTRPGLPELAGAPKTASGDDDDAAGARIACPERKVDFAAAQDHRRRVRLERPQQCVAAVAMAYDAQF